MRIPCRPVDVYHGSHSEGIGPRWLEGCPGRDVPFKHTAGPAASTPNTNQCEANGMGWRGRGMTDGQTGANAIRASRPAAGAWTIGPAGRYDERVGQRTRDGIL